MNFEGIIKKIGNEYVNDGNDINKLEDMKIIICVYHCIAETSY